MTVGQRLSPLVLGHRGAPRAEPENTRAAIEAAIALGADGVEFDVRRTGDGQLVLHHDADTASGLVIRDVEYSALPPSVPLLDEILDLTDRCEVVNVEIKDHPLEVGHVASSTTAAAVAEALSARSHTGHVVVSSFSSETLTTLRENAPALRVGWLTGRGEASSAIDEALTLGARAIHPAAADVTAELVADAHAAGLSVATWTVNDPERARELAGFGVDAVITDLPAEIRAALGRQV